MINALKDQIIEAFQDKWELNDKAHREEHFEEVFQCGLHINNVLGMGYDEKAILYAAYFHDMFAWSRVNHHDLSYHWMLGTDHPLVVLNFNTKQIKAIAWACRQHRASFEGKFEFKFCELINSADRGFPGDVPAMLQRAIQYRVKNHPDMSEDQRVVESIKHLKEKFGPRGYARYPQMYRDVFGEQLEAQRQQIMEL